MNSLLLLLVSALASSTVAEFIHPGLLHTTEDLDRVRSFVEAGTEPWITGYNKLNASRWASLDYGASPYVTVYSNDPDHGSEGNVQLQRDAAAAYDLAMMWQLTGDTAYGDAAAAVMDAWSSTFESFVGDSNICLRVGIQGYQWANAAELLRSYEGWTGLEAFKEMMYYYYTKATDFIHRHNNTPDDHYWANWDLANLAAMQAIGILNDNQTIYDEAIGYYFNGAGNGNIGNAIWITYEEEDTGKILGQGQEAGRDQGHAMLDFALLGVLCQQSYNQGLDLYAANDSLVLAGAEYAAKYNLGNDVPYTTYNNSDVSQPVIAEAGRGNVRPAWEILYAHYGVIKKLDASWTLAYRDMVVEAGAGAEGGNGDYGSNFDSPGLGTLLYRLE